MLRSVRFGPLVAMSISLLPSALAAQDDDFLMRVHFIDVGQGDATLVEFRCGAVLVDTGGERFPDEGFGAIRFDSNVPLYEYLRAFFSRRTDLGGRLKALYLTHPHPDHTRGVRMVLEEFEPENIVHNGQRRGAGIDAQNEARRFAQVRDDVNGWYVLQDHTEDPGGLSNTTIDPIDCGSEGDPEIRALWGQVTDDQGWHSSDFDDENNHSLVLRMSAGGASVIFTGDLEEAEATNYEAGIERLLRIHGWNGDLDADVFQIGHHGSHNGNSDALTQAVSPEIAVISVGPACQRGTWSAWKFGHPRRATLDELAPRVSGTRSTIAVPVFPRYNSRPEAYRVTQAIYATAWDGTVVATAASDGTWTVETDPPAGCEGR